MKPNLHPFAKSHALAGIVCLALAPAASFSKEPAASTAAARSSQPAPAQIAARQLAAATAQPTEPPPSLPVELSNQAAQIGATVNAVVGKSILIRHPEAIMRISVGNPAIADLVLVSQNEVHLLGKDLGTTNMVVWAKSGRATVIDIEVSADTALLERELREFLPGETDIRAKPSADSIVLQGSVSDALKAQQAVEITQAWIRRLTRGVVLPVTASDGHGGSTTVQVGETRGVVQTALVAGPRVINMLRVRGPQQVMLEVKIAEVSRTLLDKLGVGVAKQVRSGGTTIDFLSKSSFPNQLLGAAAIAHADPLAALKIDAQRDDALVKVLAEPNIMAISGQEASFNVGGKIFIPVARADGANGGVTTTLEEREFGVGVKFTPTVLDGARINLRVAPQVSELQQTGSAFTTVNGVTSVLPSFTVRRVETTVQLSDGQSFMIAGLVKNNVAQEVSRFPALGDIPILGALFRSTEFRGEKTELMFVITPRLVAPLPPNSVVLPTDHYIEPSAAERAFEGKLEGKREMQPPPTARKSAAAPATTGGFELR